MKTHAEAKTNVPARHAHTMPMPNALAHQARRLAARVLRMPDPVYSVMA